MNPDTRHSPSRSPRRGRWLSAGLGLLAAVAIASCSGDDGAPGQNGKDGTSPRLPIGRGEALPGFNIAVLSVSGGTGPNGNFRPGDAPRVAFTVKDDAGADIARDDWDRLQMYVSGPSFNYQRVTASTDVRAGVTAGANAGEWVCALPALPADYIEPYNYTGNFDIGVLAGQPLLDGTYSIGIEGRTIVEVEGVGEVRDTSNVVAHFLLGSASSLDVREVVGEENCFQCHVELRAHGDNRTDLVGCLLCHTAGAEDGNNPAVEGGTPDVTIDFRVMIHKIHAGASLPSVLGMSTNPDGRRNYDADQRPYKLLGFRDSVVDYSHVKFPHWPNFAQPMPRDVGHTALTTTPLGRNPQAMEDTMRSGPVQCYLCHGDPDGDGPIGEPAQGELAYAQPSRMACGSCHDDWIFDQNYLANGINMPPQLDDSECTVCHRADGGALDVKPAHRHPLLDPAVATGVKVLVDAIREAGTNDGDGTIDVGERIELEVRVTDAAGNAIDASTLPRRELTIAGPTTNPNLLQLFSLPGQVFSGAQPYVFHVPEQIWAEIVGTSSGAGGQVFGTGRAPHWSDRGAPTQVFLRDPAGTGGESATLLAPATAFQNFIDVPLTPGGGTAFARNAWIVIADGTAQEEHMRVSWVEEMADRRRLWFGARNVGGYPANLRFAHAAGAAIERVDLVAQTETTDYTLDPVSGAITEVNNEFGTNNRVLVTYVTDFEMPEFYQGSLNDSLDLGSDFGDWIGLPIVDGSYLVNLAMEQTVSVSPFGETTNYIDGSEPTIDPATGYLASFLVGDADTFEPPTRIAAVEGCVTCHGDIQFHGDHRRGYQNCTQCHGVAGAEDRPRYVAPNAPATPGTSIEFRTMLHKIHHGRNLSAGADYIVNGFGTGFPDNFTAYTYEHIGYPVLAGGTSNCASCHGSADAWKSPVERNHPTAMDAMPTRSWTAACVTCHDSSAARAHADVNTSRLGEESCAVCHGAGKDLSVETVHFVR
jgi:hypothetical protein